MLISYDTYGSDEICEALNISIPYMYGFTDGFDDVSFGCSMQVEKPKIWDERSRAEYHMGFDHGVAARNAVCNQDIANTKEVLNFIIDAK